MGNEMGQAEVTARNARREASARLGVGYQPFVLEPSPPAIVDSGYFADDPVVGEVADDAIAVVPFGETRTGVTWHSIASGDEQLTEFATGRWLGPWKALGSLPRSYVATRRALHQVAVYVISPARREANGKIALRYTYRGCGTPYFVRDQRDTQVRIDHGQLVVQEGDGVRAEPITTLEAAAALVGVEVDRAAAEQFDVPPVDEGRLAVDPDAALALGDWYGFTASVLEELRADARAETAAPAPSRVQLWPEHFDLAFDAGDPGRKTRANYGGSPGDGGSDEPYLYVGPFDRDGLGEDPYWNAPFGATLGYQQLLATDDQRGAALAFFRQGRDRLQNRST